MIRHAAAVVIVLLLSPSWVTAQGTELTVNASSASVHKAPSTASPVIGQAARGTRLAVTRNVGDWVKVAWPSAADGVGYVRVSVGSVSNGACRTARRRLARRCRATRLLSVPPLSHHPVWQQRPPRLSRRRPATVCRFAPPHHRLQERRTSSAWAPSWVVRPLVSA